MKRSSSCIILLLFLGLVISYGNPVHAEEVNSQVKVKVTYTVDVQASTSTDRTNQSDSNSSAIIEKANKVEKNNQLKLFLETNERKSIMGSLIGGILLLYLGIVYVIRKKKETK